MRHIQAALLSFIAQNGSTSFIKLNNVDDVKGVPPTVTFTIQSDPVSEVGVNGLQVIDIIKYSLELLLSLNVATPCGENLRAIEGLTDAINALEARTRDRELRGVEGTQDTDAAPSGLESLAMVCHEANRAYCEYIGDLSQLRWAVAPQWQKDSAVQGVKFRIENPDATPENMHESWFEDKRADGWTYGPTKDAEKKQHPCMVPYSELPKSQQKKDYLFNAVVDILSTRIS